MGWLSGRTEGRHVIKTNPDVSRKENQTNNCNEENVGFSCWDFLRCGLFFLFDIRVYPRASSAFFPLV